MSSFFKPSYMNEIMGMFCPEGETVITAAYGVGKKTEIYQYFGGCMNVGDKLIPADTDNIIKVFKMKVCTYDLYIGYTEKSLIISECDMATTYYYDFDNITDPILTGVKRLEKEITHKSIGKVFPLESIQSFEVKKGWFGSLNCVLKLNNGTFFKFMLAKRAGVGGQMPDHMQNRDKLIEVFKQYSQVRKS